VRVGRVGDAAGRQVAVEASLVDGADRAEAHRDRREFPEVGHQTRVRIGRESVRRFRPLLAEPVEMLLREPTLEKRAGIDPRRGVALEVDLVSGARGEILATEEVVEADLVQRSCGGVGRDMAADAEVFVGSADHDGRVPPDVGPDPPLDVLIAGKPRLTFGWDRVDIIGAPQRGHPHLSFSCPLEQLQHEVAGSLPAVMVDSGVEGLDPFAGLARIDIGQLVGQAVCDDAVAIASHTISVLLVFKCSARGRHPARHEMLTGGYAQELASSGECGYLGLAVAAKMVAHASQHRTRVLARLHH
jgi:hypothetical protein